MTGLRPAWATYPEPVSKNQKNFSSNNNKVWGRGRPRQNYLKSLKLPNVSKFGECSELIDLKHSKRPRQERTGKARQAGPSWALQNGSCKEGWQEKEGFFCRLQGGDQSYSINSHMSIHEEASRRMTRGPSEKSGNLHYGHGTPDVQIKKKCSMSYACMFVQIMRERIPQTNAIIWWPMTPLPHIKNCNQCGWELTPEYQTKLHKCPASAREIPEPNCWKQVAKKKTSKVSEG